MKKIICVALACVMGVAFANESKLRESICEVYSVGSRESFERLRTEYINYSDRGLDNAMNNMSNAELKKICVECVESNGDIVEHFEKEISK